MANYSANQVSTLPRFSEGFSFAFKCLPWRWTPRVGRVGRSCTGRGGLGSAGGDPRWFLRSEPEGSQLSAQGQGLKGLGFVGPVTTSEVSCRYSR